MDELEEVPTSQEVGPTLHTPDLTESMRRLAEAIGRLGVRATDGVDELLTPDELAERGRYKRPDGTYGSTSGYPTKKAALDAASDEESRIRHNTWIDPRVAEITFGEFAEQHHAAISPRLSPNTVAKYRGYLDRQLLPKWEGWPMIGIFNSHLEIEGWVSDLHDDYEESSVASFFALFSTIMNAAVRARVIPASPCPGIRVTGGEWESEKLVATPVQSLRAGMRLYENGLGIGGLLLCLVDVYTGARWGELAGQTKREYDEVNRAIGIVAPLKEVNGRLMKGNVDVTERESIQQSPAPGRRTRRPKRGGRTKSPTSERWVQLPPTIATIYELHLDTLSGPEAFAFTSLGGGPWYRSNFRQRFWRPAWDGVKLEDPESPKHQPVILDGFRFHEGRHTQLTWLAEDGVPEIARRARVGQKMPGIAQVYEHVTPEMLRKVRDALEARWLASVLALTMTERDKLLSWVPKLRPTIEAAGEKGVSQISPTATSGGVWSGGEGAS